jgi:predicted RNA-binding Zn-ribbon protein involved in translation (DUF1610 family)
MKPSRDAALLMCRACGFIPGITPIDAPLTNAQNPTANAQNPVKLSMAIQHRGELPLRVRSLYESGVAAAGRGDHVSALDCFRDALGLEPDFVDAHLGIARVSSEPNIQREHLDVVLAYDPGNGEALRMWMVLKGQLSADGAARAASGHMPDVRTADGAVTTHAQVLLCRVCGGHLTVDDETGHAVCRFCGAEADMHSERDVNARSLGMAMIARKAEPVRWQVGERIMHCNQCGAERIIGATVLSMQCPFCGSTQVIEQDALGSFVQPDGIVPFALNEQEVIAAIKRQLQTPQAKLAALLDDHRVKSGTIDGVYVPFWVFDISLLITRRQTQFKNPSGQRTWKSIPSMQLREEQFGDALFNVPTPALRSLDRRLMTQIDDYTFSDAQPYNPTLLAKYPASLYDVDFEKASMDAREHASRHMRQKHDTVDMQHEQMMTSAMVQHMTFSLLLLPVFVVLLRERDGEERPALVNGQTGAVALGQSR